MKELLTVAEYAELANVSKQAVYKAIKHPNSELQPYIVADENQIFIKSIALEKLGGCPTYEAEKTVKKDASAQIIEILNEQLKIKDEQIRILQEQHNTLLNLVSQSQELQAQANYLLADKNAQEAESAEADEAEHAEAENAPQNAQEANTKHSWLYRLLFE